jgi:hypothetical protein
MEEEISIHPLPAWIDQTHCLSGGFFVIADDADDKDFADLTQGSNILKHIFENPKLVIFIIVDSHLHYLFPSASSAIHPRNQR